LLTSGFAPFAHAAGVRPDPRDALPESALSISDGLFLSLDLEEGPSDRVVGYRAKKNSLPVDLAKIRHYRWNDFWEPVYPEQGSRIVLEPDAGSSTEQEAKDRADAAAKNTDAARRHAEASEERMREAAQAAQREADRADAGTANNSSHARSAFAQ
jgi:phage protein D